MLHKSQMPRPAPVAPPCPKWFGKEEKRAWKRVCRTLADLRLLGSSDGAAIERYVLTTIQYRRACEFLNRADAVRPADQPPGTYRSLVDGHERFLPFPTCAEVLRLSRQLQAFEDRFGLNPLSRKSLVADDSLQLHGDHGPDPETYFFAPRPVS